MAAHYLVYEQNGWAWRNSPQYALFLPVMILDNSFGLVTVGFDVEL